MKRVALVWLFVMCCVGFSWGVASIIQLFLASKADAVQATPAYKKYSLHDGRVVYCASADELYCGYNLTVCVDHREYLCQTNLRIERGDKNDFK